LLRTAHHRARRKIGSWAQLTTALAGKSPPAWLRDTFSATACVIGGVLNVTGVSKVVLVGDMLELGTGVLARMTDEINLHALWGRFGEIRVEAAPRQRLVGLALAALDRVVLAPTPAEVSAAELERGIDVV